MNYAIIMAAGSSERMTQKTPKVLRMIAGQTVLQRVIGELEKAETIDSLVLVVPKDRMKEYIDRVSQYKITKSMEIVQGDDTRTESVLNGLKAVDKNCEMVAIHDAARVMITAQIIDETMKLAQQKGAAVAGGRVYDTIKQMKGTRIQKSLDRSKLVAAFTPQIFKYKELMVAYLDAKQKGQKSTDSATIMEQAGYKVAVYDIGKRDIKITVEEDIIPAEAMITGGKMHVGTGIDTHRLAEKRKLILGGVDIPFNKGLLGHSDADVLIHAIMDALLGAAGLGDIGRHFPDTDKKYEGISSIKLLKRVGEMLNEKSYEIMNIDTTIICQAPKLAPFNSDMTKNIAQALKIHQAQVNIKATTTEGIGEHGDGIAISAIAVCALKCT